MKLYQQLIQNLISQKGWGQPKMINGPFEWEFTHDDGSKRRYQADLPDAYNQLMADEGYVLDALETGAWVKAATKRLPRHSGLDLRVNTYGDTFEHGNEPGAWVEVTGRIWVPISDALDVTQPKDKELS